MLVEFSVVPIGVGQSVGDSVAKVLAIVKDSGLPYKINPMGTVVEGQWNDIMKLLKKCHTVVLKDCERVITNIKIDDRKGKTGRIDYKVKSVEKRLGAKLRQ